MARPVSYLPRLHAMLQSVKVSSRSHYNRRDLELLFKLQPRAAASLFELMPTTRQGNQLLVKREDLEGYLAEMQEQEDVAAVLVRRRAAQQAPSRRKPRGMVLREFEPTEAKTLATWMSPGLLEVRFITVEQLADVLWRIACCLQDEAALEEFIRLYEPARPAKIEAQSEREGVRAMFSELEEMEAARG